MDFFIKLVTKYPRGLIFIFSCIILLIIVRTGHIVRSVAYDQAPETNFLDEYTNVWHGLSIRTGGVPSAWSDLRSYWDTNPTIQGRFANDKGGLSLNGFNIFRNNEKPSLFPKRNFTQLTIFTTEFNFGDGIKHTSIMQPYLDHPPFGALVLSLLVPESQNTFQKITPLGSRKTSIWLADITAILIFLLAYQLFKNPLIALISAGVYVSAPTFFFTSRMALLENVLIPTQLLSLNLLVYAIQKLTANLKIYRIFLSLSGIAAGLAFLSKTPGFAVIIAGVIILFLYKDSFKNILFFLIPGLLVSSIYFIWGMVLAPDIFPKLLTEQSTKRIFIGSLNFITASFKYGWKNFPIDGWWVGGFLTLIFLKTNKQFYPLTVSLGLTLFVILFTGASAFPWYFIPLIPFLAIAIASFLWDIATAPTTTKVLIFFLIFVSSTYFWAKGVVGANPNYTNHEQQFLIYKFMLSLSFVASIICPSLVNKNRLFKTLWFIGIILLIYILIKWNFKSIFYMLSHWGLLIDNYSPNWKL